MPRASLRPPLTQPPHPRPAPPAPPAPHWGHAALQPLVLALATALPWQAMAQTAKPAPTALPVPAGSSVVGWRTYGSGQSQLPTATPNAKGGRDMLIQQSDPRAIYNWASFNIGESSSVTFDMAQGGSSALNRIHDANPSQIFGSLRTGKNGGEIILYNRNGILFGSGSSVNVGSLIATTLSPRDADFKSGFSANVLGSDPAFSYHYDPAPDAGLYGSSYVQVAPGAQISSGEGGRILLFAKQVNNAGGITSPGGQVVLGAGAEAYLRLPTGDALYASEVNPAVPSLRGLLVDMGNAGLSTAGDGSVANQASGVISTPRGNTTLVGMAVNQAGRLSATTSVSQNGSILLLAQGSASTTGIGPGDDRYKRAQANGELVLATGSRTEIPSTQTVR